MQRQDHAIMTTEAARATDWLARGGLRPTRQRLALAKLLAEAGDKLFWCLHTKKINPISC